jgi:hypothetical protein
MGANIKTIQYVLSKAFFALLATLMLVTNGPFWLMLWAQKAFPNVFRGAMILAASLVLMLMLRWGAIASLDTDVISSKLLRAEYLVSQLDRLSEEITYQRSALYFGNARGLIDQKRFELGLISKKELDIGQGVRADLKHTFEDRLKEVQMQYLEVSREASAFYREILESS